MFSFCSTSASPSSCAPSCHHHHTSHACTALPVSCQNASSQQDTCINYSSPQCCHCGWRGGHSPNCPFKRR
ncbi:hypothetical protein NEOLEDRAFT_1054402 [Neolentinus lepideus HHB14362 ss-1]|uniref:Uncharacterized protein n=1 Tax=Neolentinus lepideus HHB14362 ss-1 TaxID=1314782 RepID=A0A165WCF1_9AGAM|nr:hypothetical protein NEOLEDRAFT_1054402 [Neolentinus lepideus HHB14362 ss-1]